MIHLFEALGRKMALDVGSGAVMSLDDIAYDALSLLLEDRNADIAARLAEKYLREEAEETAELSAGALFMQGVATSIDALSVGFTISEYGWLMALVCSLIVAAVTFFICEAGLSLGKKFGTKLSGKASILGGVILIGIGLEIFISGVFG